jgi:hypothetical protein
MTGGRHFPDLLIDMCMWVDMFVILAGSWITYSGGTEALGNTASSTVCLISLCWLTSNSASCSPSKLQYTVTDKCHTLPLWIFEVKYFG